MGDLLADDLVGVRGQAGGFGVRQGNHFERDLRRVEEERGVVAGGRGRAAPGVGAHRLGRRRVWGGTGQALAQGHLLGRRIGVSALGFLTEDLALEPGQLMFELGDTGL